MSCSNGQKKTMNSTGDRIILLGREVKIDKNCKRVFRLIPQKPKKGE